VTTEDRDGGISDQCLFDNNADMTRLLFLPSEVLIEIFSYLHPRDIAVCQRSCRQLNDTVSHSQLLQYLIHVGRAGLHDLLFPGYTIRQRIDALEK